MAEEDLGKTRSVGVGLKDAEIDEFEHIAESLGFSRNAIMAWALRHFLAEFKAGQILVPIEEEVTRTLGKP